MLRGVVKNWSRILTWVWLGAVATGAAVGMAGAYRDPDLLRIDAFSAIYSAAGLSDRLMITVVLVLPMLGAIGAGAFILIRRGAERSAVVFAVGLVAIYFFSSGAVLGLPQWLANSMASVSLVLMVGFLVTFPSGTFRPRWAGAAPALTLLLVVVRWDLPVAMRVAMTTPQDFEDRVLAGVGLGTIFVIAALSQVVRYRRMSSTTERLQTRWVLAALVLMLMPPTMFFLFIAVGIASSPVLGYVALVTALGSFALPAAVAVAAFRYHLYEIDRIISRTLTYAAVAVVVTAVYVGIVLGLPTLLGTTGEVYVAGGTLAAAAVFSPVRRRLQRTIERRFNRARYDSDRELGQLSARMSTVTDLDGVGHEVTGLLHRTIEPANVGVWFADPPG